MVRPLPVLYAIANNVIFGTLAFPLMFGIATVFSVLLLTLSKLA